MDVAQQGILHGQGGRVAEAVKRAWTVVLNRRSFEANLPWDDAGGNSLDAIRLWCLIEEALDKKLPIDDLESSMTPVQLIATVEKAIAAVSSPRVKRRSEKPLVFYMPVADGDTLLQAQWRAAVGARVRFEVIRYPSWRDMLEGGSGFDGMIDSAVNQILSASDGPINLVGFSFGGFAAWATACKLVELGHSVAFVGLIDARRYRDVNLPQGVFAEAAKVAQRIVFEPKVAATRAIKNGVALTIRVLPAPLLRRLCRVVHLLPAGFSSKFDQHLVEQLRLHARSAWSPTPLDGPAYLFRSDEFLPNAPDFGWSRLCSRLTLIPVGSNHVSLLSAPASGSPLF